jgi:hypothetical protein
MAQLIYQCHHAESGFRYLCRKRHKQQLLPIAHCFWTYKTTAELAVSLQQHRKSVWDLMEHGAHLLCCRV